MNFETLLVELGTEELPPKSLKSPYINEKKIIMYEDKPMLLIPYYNVSFSHFLTADSPKDGVSQLY